MNVLGTGFVTTKEMWKLISVTWTQRGKSRKFNLELKGKRFHSLTTSI